MTIQIAGKLTHVHQNCACGNSHKLGEICPDCKSEVLQVVTIEDVDSLCEIKNFCQNHDGSTDAERKYSILQRW